MFIGRKQELAALEKRYGSGRFEFPVIYGRRRVGKTRLIREFIQDKPAVYFMATEQSKKEQLANLTAAVREQIPDLQTRLLDSFSSFEDLFAYLTEVGRHKRLVFVIDEYPYLAKAAPEISSILQKVIDQEWKDTELYLILCGSSMSFMERQVLSYQSPLYGRRTAQLKLHALPYYEAVRFFPGWTEEEKMMAYGICDGIPQYLLYLSHYENLEEAVCEELLSPSGHLQEEPENLMLQELREPAVYNSILTAVAHGANRLHEIASAVGKDSSGLAFYLKNLQDLELVRKIQPVENTSSRKSLYQLADNLYRFWFRFIPGCSSLIALGMGKQAWEQKIRPQFPAYFGHVFEEIALQYIQYQVKQGSGYPLYLQYGSWWGTDPRKRREEEIDLVCTDEENILCGECKWKQEPMDLPVLRLLQERSELIRKGRKIQYALFSRAGFTPRLETEARKENVLLLTPRELLV